MSSRFIKLSKVLLNPSKINMILCDEKKYTIEMSNSYIYGSFFFASGYIDSYENKFEICKTKHPEDYAVLEKWIKSNQDI